uniref:Uncharacterized protein AlNc14C8G1049 n=1 Tax=Albugo laibachii Nc14 TaxID=890382 RepID=F0W1X0_9STRA|nr:conserved hypothetical protein [Albugo laibachii Nc14]|eukprot:CCA15049.1 conserved hypothetical protein [Albugo laibachii Nc14]
MKNRLVPGSMYFPQTPLNTIAPSMQNSSMNSVINNSNYYAQNPSTFGAEQATNATSSSWRLGTSTPTTTTKALSSNKQLGELLRSIEPRFCYQPAVEELLLEMADQFVNDVVQLSSQLARHRGSSVLEGSDLQFHLAKSYGISLTGYFPKDETFVDSNAKATVSNTADIPSLIPAGKDLSTRLRPNKNSLHMHRIALKRRTLTNIKRKIKNRSKKLLSMSADRRKANRNQSRA